MKTSICKIFSFEAAHYLPYYVGKCSKMHGHTFKLEVEVSGNLIQSGPKVGMVMDFGTLKGIVQREVIDILDHSTLNDIIENPTAENALIWIRSKLACIQKETLTTGGLVRLRLYETPNSYAEVTDVSKP